MTTKDNYQRPLVHLTLVLVAFLACGVGPAPLLRASGEPRSFVIGRAEARVTRPAPGGFGAQLTSGSDGVLRRGLRIATSYVGPQDLQESLQNNSVQLSIALADFDEDGSPDLVSGYTSSGTGIMTLHRGNKKSLLTQSGSAPPHTTESVFEAEALISELPDTPDFLWAGDFDSDRHADIVAAARGRQVLFLLPGNGQGGFSQPSSIELDGGITAIAAKDNEVVGVPADLAVAIHSDRGSRVLVFAGAQGSLNAKPREIELMGSVTKLEFGNLNGDHNVDLLAMTDIDLIVVNGRGGWAQNARLVVTQRSFSVLLRSVTIGDFNGDGWSDIAVLSSDGMTRVLQNSRKAPKKNLVNRWKDVPLDQAIRPHSTNVLRARMNEHGADDLVIVDPPNQNLHVTGIASNAVTATLDTHGAPVTFLAIDLNGDTIEDLVGLISGRNEPVVFLSGFSPAVATLELSRSAPSPNPASVNQDIVYTFVARNAGAAGDGTISNAVFSVMFSGPAIAITSIRCAPLGGPPPGDLCGSTIGQTVTVQLGNLSPDIPSGFVRQFVTITIVVRALASGTLSDSATLTGTCPDPEVPFPCAPQNTAGTVVVQAPPPPAQPNLQITKIASSGTVAAGSDVTYTINVSNTGGATASNVLVVDTLSSALVARSCSFGCGAGTNPVQTTIPSLAPGQSQTFTITAMVKCDTPAGTVGNTATASIPVQSVQSSPANINVTNNGTLRLSTTQSSTIDFGTASLGAAVTRDLVVENTFSAACATLFNTTSLNRSGPDVSRISNRADTTFFRITRTDGTAVNIGQPVTLQSGLTTFRIIFSPNAPVRPGTNTNLSASQVLPTSLTSQLTISGITTPVTLTAGVSRTVRIIGNVSLSVTGDTFDVSVDVFSPDFADVTTFTVKLLDAQNNTVAENTANVSSTIQQANLVRGQTFGLVQTGSGIGDKQVTRAEVTVSGPGGTAGPIRSAAATQSSNPTNATASRHSNIRPVFSNVRLRR